MAAWDATTGNCVLGWHISDADATSASNFTSKRRHVPSALVAEALALKTAVSTAVLRGATSLVKRREYSLRSVTKSEVVADLETGVGSRPKTKLKSEVKKAKIYLEERKLLTKDFQKTLYKI
ncbi:hypothetical protein YC2023_039338 [Brassica napus]